MTGKIRLLVFVLTAACLLTGCADVWVDSYQTIEPHEAVISQSENVELRPVNNYNSLLRALREAVTDHVPEVTFDVSQYGTTLESELSRAFQELKTEPIPSYAVQEFNSKVTEVGARRMVAVTVDYRRSQEEVESIDTIWGSQALQREICSAMDAVLPSKTILMHGYSTVDMNAIANAYYLEHLDSIMECPTISADIYPNAGSVRLLELKFYYSYDQQKLLDMRRETQGMLSSAAGYVRSQEDLRTKADRLYALLRPLIGEVKTTRTPVYSLLSRGEGDSYSIAVVYSLFCAQAGLECQVVTGTLDEAEYHWNLIRLEDNWYHVDISSEQDDWNLTLHYDDEMRGYNWDTERYPASSRPQAVAVTTEPPAPRETEYQEEIEPLTESTEPVSSDGGEEDLPEPETEPDIPQETAPEEMQNP